MKYKNLLQAAIVTAFMMSCSGGTEGVGQELTTESGIAYEFIKKGSSAVPPAGGFWTINVDYYDESGELMFSSANQGGPMTMNYMGNFPANASIEECLGLVGEGDSAVFFISADSLYKNSSGRGTPPELVGTKIKLNVGVDKVYTVEEFEAFMANKEKEQIAAEEEAIMAYLTEQNISYETTDDGLFYELQEPGSGELAKPGQTVRVAYKGYLLDGTVFDTSYEEAAKEAGLYNPNRPYEPYQFVLGTQSVIKGWDLGVALLAEGGKAKIIVPSPLAYGNRGAGPQIGPNTILVFDVELVEIVK